MSEGKKISIPAGIKSLELMWNPILEGRIPLPKFGMRIIDSSAPVVTGLRARVEWQKIF